MGCKQCVSPDVARRAVFCSLSCATKYNNLRLKKKFTKAQCQRGQRSCNRNKTRAANVASGVKTQRGKNKTPKNIYEVSARTRMKMIRRLELACFACGWDKAVCDLHHIDGRKQENPHRHSNLTYLCPNCHRLAHLKILIGKIPTFEKIVGNRWIADYYG